MEGNVHGEESRECGGGEGDVLSLEAPNASEVDAEEAGESDD